jgi:hypothetical protein
MILAELYLWNNLRLSESIKGGVPGLLGVNLLFPVTPSLELLGHIQMSIKVKHGHDEVREALVTKVISNSSGNKTMFLFELLPLINMFLHIGWWLRSRTTCWRSHALEAKVGTDDGPFLAPAGGLGVVGCVEALALSASLRIKGGMDGEARNQILRRVVAACHPRLCCAWKLYFCSFAIDLAIHSEIQS